MIRIAYDGCLLNTEFASKRNAVNFLRMQYEEALYNYGKPEERRCKVVLGIDMLIIEENDDIHIYQIVEFGDPEDPQTQEYLDLYKDQEKFIQEMYKKYNV